MPRASRFLKPKFLTSEDVREFGTDGKVVVISNTRTVRINGEERLAVFFEGVERAYACNQTNLEMLIEIHGGDDDTMHWIGTRVRVYVDESILFDNQQVGGIVIEAVKEASTKSIFGRS